MNNKLPGKLSTFVCKKEEKEKEIQPTRCSGGPADRRSVRRFDSVRHGAAALFYTGDILCSETF